MDPSKDSIEDVLVSSDAFSTFSHVSFLHQKGALQ